MNFLKQAVGIDISKDELVCAIGQMDHTQMISWGPGRRFANTTSGFKKLLSWARSNRQSDEHPLWFVMEATGVYYESLAYFLSAVQAQVCVLLPNKIRYFAKSLELKSKTDPIDAEVLVKIGLERKLSPWNPATPQMRSIRVLSREHLEIKKKRTATKNQLHARKHAFETPKSTIKRLEQQIRLFDKMLLEIEQELEKIVQADEVLSAKMPKLQTIPGLSFMSLITIIGETHGFALIRNAKQLASYAGLDVVQRQSGNWSGKSYISKRGNRYLRAVMFMPALSAIRHNPALKQFYQRLHGQKPARKVGVIAVARKLLILSYTLWKNDTVFDYQIATANAKKGGAMISSSTK